MIFTTSTFLHNVIPVIVAGQCVGLAAAVAHHNQQYKKWEKASIDFRYPWDDDTDDESAMETTVDSVQSESTIDLDAAAVYDYVSGLWCDDGEYAEEQQVSGDTGGSPSHHMKPDTGGHGGSSESYSDKENRQHQIYTSPNKRPLIDEKMERLARVSAASPGAAAAHKLVEKQRQQSKSWVNSRTYSMVGVQTTLFWAEGDAVMPVHVEVR